MAESNIHYREIKKSDYAELEQLIRDIWQYEKYWSPKTAKATSKLFLTSCLSSQTYTCVAVNNGEIVGIIMAKKEKDFHTPKRYRIANIGAALNMLSTKESREVAKFYAGYGKMNEGLLAGCGESFHGELALFAVGSDQQGTGIGKELFRRAKEYMRAEKIEKFYLYTDTLCNIGFYEHKGMRRIAEKNRCVKEFGNKDITFFIYADELVPPQ